MNYKCVTDINELRAYLDWHKIAAFDIETAPDDAYRGEQNAALDPHKSHICGVSFSVAAGTGVYVPIAHRQGQNMDTALFKPFIIEFLRNTERIKIAHNLSFESSFFYALGIVISAPVYDTIMATMLTLKTRTEFRKLSDSGLKTLVPELYGVELPTFESVTGGRFFDELDPSDFETVRYACADSDYALRLYDTFNGWFDRYLPRHRFVVEHLESPTAVYVGAMKFNGLLVDKDLMLEKQAEAEGKLARLKEEIAFIVGGVDIGANASTSAFKQYLFKDLGLPVVKTTAKYQEAADDEVMVLLAEWCAENKPELVQLFRLVQEYRKWGKLKSTYVDGYLEHINSATGRIHPNLMQMGTDTGRFSCNKPNLQNCFDDKTEILTKRGFVLFSELTENDEVAQWENGEIAFVQPLEWIANDYNGEMVQIKNQHIDMCMTPDHRCLLQNRRNRQFAVIPASEYCTDYKQLQAAQYAFGNKSLSDAEISVLTATQADGSYKDGGIEFGFDKAQKYRRLKNAVSELGIKHSDNVRGNGQVTIRLLAGEGVKWLFDILGAKKTWNSSLMEYDRKTIRGILSEIMHWDGCFTRNNHYSSSVKENADWMQILNTLTGKRAHMREYWNGNPNSAVNYQIDVTDREYSLTANIEKSLIKYNGKVYCVAVPSGYIVVRRGGQVCVTGNCPRAGSDDLIGVRNFIIAPEGKTLVSVDLSQIELRVGAFYCRDEAMLETYRNGGDIHGQTTSVIYKIPFEQAIDKNAEDFKNRRAIAKNCNFGVFFGLFAKGLQRNLKFKAGLNVTLEECEEIISNLMSGYPELSNWQRKIKAKAKEYRYSETALGRRRYLPNILSRDWGKKSFAERCALNTPIQGTAADILKMSMARIAAGLQEREWLRPLLQIHDELLFETPTDKVSEAAAFIKACMEVQPFDEFDMPIIAEASAGLSFGNLL